jgi:hypothetical protein
MNNKYGLSRDIPAEVKRAVRQRCGFGCVICGSGIIQYEHVDPEFPDATEHNPDHITLLCPQCHAKVTTGFWSKQKVKDAMGEPKCKIQGYSREVFDIGKGHPMLQFGGVVLKNCLIPIQVRERELFKIEAPEEEEGPFRFSGFFCDSKGNLSLQIIQNEWFAQSSNWDVEVTGGSIIIRERKGLIHLKLDAKPPDTLVVDRLNMNLEGFSFEANGDFLRVTFPNGGICDFTSCLADNCRVGFHFDSK